MLDVCKILRLCGDRECWNIVQRFMVGGVARLGFRSRSFLTVFSVGSARVL